MSSDVSPSRLPLAYEPDRLDPPEWLRDAVDGRLANKTWDETTDAVLGADRRERFREKWARGWWGGLLGLDRAWSKWTRSSALLTFTTSPKRGGTVLPPVHHLDNLEASRGARHTALSRALSNVSWESVTVVGADENGYAHLHTAVWADESVGPERFRSVIASHVENAPGAGSDAHRITDDAERRGDDFAGGGAVVVNTEPSAPTGALAYAGMNAPGMDGTGDSRLGLRTDGVAGSSALLATTLVASGRRAIRTER